MGKKEKKKNGVDFQSQFETVVTVLYEMVSEPYYLFHIIAFFSYFSFRFSSSHILDPNFSAHLIHRELQAVLAFSVLIVVKIVKEDTWEGIIADTFFFAKVFLVAISFVLDYHLALWFTLVFLVLYVSTQQPAYPGLGTSTQITPLQLEALLTEGNTSRFWLVEFRTLFSSACIRTSRILPELSITFSNKYLSFGVIDLGLFPNTAERFGITLGKAEQLPTYILFENAEEVNRFPAMFSEAKASNPPISKKLVCRHFELDKHLVDYISST